MAHLNVERKKRLKVYLVAILVLCSLFILTACNPNGDAINMANQKSVGEPTHFIAKFLIILNNGIGDFGWTVVVFTIILKLITTPFDFWQKHIMRKNAKIMERLKPQLDALAEKCGDDKQRYQQEQMAMYKREKYSTLGACIPTIITLVVFFVVFAGFRQMVSYENALVYQSARNTYYAEHNNEYAAAMEAELKTLGLTDEQIAKVLVIEREGEKIKSIKINPTELTAEQRVAIEGCDARSELKAKDLAQRAVLNNYKRPKFLWIWNIFSQDSWVYAVPDYTTFSGQSGMSGAKIEGVMVTEYETVMGKVLGTGGYGKDGKWNGLLIFPLLSIGLNILSQFMMQKAQGKQPKAQAGQASSKMMQWIMPVMMGVFALLYSAAFTIYIFTSTLYSILFQLLFNLFAKVADKNKERMLGIRR